MTRIDPTYESDPTKPKQPDKSLGELFGDLGSELGDLVKTQVELAKTEIKDEVGKFGKVAGIFGGAAFAGYLAAVLLAFAAAWGLSEIVPEGVAFLIVGVVLALVAGVLYLRGRDRAKSVKLVPRDTVESMKEDVQWARQKLS